MDKHEIQAEINARDILLRQTQDAAIAHLEAVVGSLLAKMDAPQRADVLAEVAGIEKLTPDVQAVVCLRGESGTKSKRQVWREERAALELQLANAPEPAGSEMY